jgi:membrane associated rhomboid family serine protease
MGVRVSNPDGLSYLTYAFLHGGWLHLIGNGILLLILGCYVERAWGSALFGVLAMVSALAAATAFRVGNPGLNAALIGTSGMLAGLLAAYTVRFSSEWTEAGYYAVIVGGLCWLTLPSGFGWVTSVVPGPTLGGDVAQAGNPSIWALAGGIGFGLVFSAMVRFGKIESVLSNVSEEPARKPNVEPDLEAALEAHADGRSDEAFELISALLEKKPEYRAALLAMWDVALVLRRPVDASQAMLKVIRDEVRRNVPSAVDHWLDLAGRGLQSDVEPALLIHVALMLRESDHPNEALNALQQALDASAEGGSPELAARIAQASQSLDRRFTESVAWQALGSVDLAFSDRQNLEALLGALYRESPPEWDADDAPSGDERVESSSQPPEESVPFESRAADPLLRWEDPELPDETGLPREDPLTPAESRTAAEGISHTAASVRPAPIDMEFSSRELRLVPAQPSELAEDGLVIEIEGGEKRKIAFDRIDAISVVAVDGLGPKFVVVVDLVLNWMSEPTEPLKVIRLRGDRFDPRHFATDQDAPLDAMRAFTSQLLSRSNATALPDATSVRGTPFASFSDIASYQAAVLSIEEDA